MIISRTPLRISLIGGGSDVPAFYRKFGGAVVSFAIDKYVFVSVNDKFDGRNRVAYSVTEDVDDPKQIKHDLVREAMDLTHTKGVEITSVSDIPGTGTGLGSSSSFTVGLVSCLNRKAGYPYTQQELAESAHFIESSRCNHVGVGKQDQYAASYGGLRYYEFKQDGKVETQEIMLAPLQVEALESQFLLFWTGRVRSAETILKEQSSNLQENTEAIYAASKLAGLAHDLGIELQKGNISCVGKYLFYGWRWKKYLSASISDGEMDRIHDKAIEAGAIGGKLLGAGGGGFFLFFAPVNVHSDIRESLGLRQVPFKIESKGSEIIYDNQAQTSVRGRQEQENSFSASPVW